MGKSKMEVKRYVRPHGERTDGLLALTGTFEVEKKIGQKNKTAQALIDEIL